LKLQFAKKVKIKIIIIKLLNPKKFIAYPIGDIRNPYPKLFDSTKLAVLLFDGLYPLSAGKATQNP